MPVVFALKFSCWIMRYWHQRADERHGNPPQGNPEPFSGQRKRCKTPGEIGVSKSVECDTFSLSVLWATGRSSGL